MLLQRVKDIARAREGLLLAIVIVVAGLAYVALDRSPLSPVPSITADTLPALAFEANALVGGGTTQRERDARLLLADGQITVTADNTTSPLHAVSYRDVLSIHYSRGRDPVWKSPKGPATIVRFTGGTLGKLGIFVDRHWISLQTKGAAFIVLRVEEPSVRKMLTALEERTGRTPEIVGRR